MMIHNNTESAIEPLLIDRETLYKYLSCGRVSGDRIAKAAGAERKIGRRVLIYKPAIDAFLADMESKQ